MFLSSNISFNTDCKWFFGSMGTFRFSPSFEFHISLYTLWPFDISSKFNWCDLNGQHFFLKKYFLDCYMNLHVTFKQSKSNHSWVLTSLHCSFPATRLINWSLLNYVLHVLSYPTYLLPHMPHALSALVLYVPRAL